MSITWAYRRIGNYSAGPATVGIGPFIAPSFFRSCRHVLHFGHRCISVPVHSELLCWCVVRTAVSTQQEHREIAPNALLPRSLPHCRLHPLCLTHEQSLACYDDMRRHAFDFFWTPITRIARRSSLSFSPGFRNSAVNHRAFSRTALPGILTIRAFSSLFCP